MTPPDEPTNVVALSLPIWNVEQLSARPDDTVLVVAGQKAALAAEIYFPSYVVVTGLLSADWRPLKGRTVRNWPDGGAGGEDRGRKLSKILMPIVAELAFHSQRAMSEGWNLATALDEGWTQKEVMAFVGREGGKHVTPLKKAKKSKELEAIEGKVTELAPAGLNVKTDYRGDLLATESNVREVLSNYEQFKGRFWFDAFAQRLMMDEEQFDPDVQGVNTLIWMQSNLKVNKLPLSAVERAADHYGRETPHHPLKEYLEPLQWDGAERLPGFMANVYGAERNAYSEAVGRCWFVSAIARVYDPGCKADCMLVLEGLQGVQKSTSLSVLGGDWFLESHEDPIHNRKDFLMQLQGNWIIEIPEMHSIAGRAHGIERIKGLISCQDDTYRKSYGRATLKHPRQCIFAGTTNLEQWNSDQTGGRRFWPIRCEKIDLDYLRENRDQLWAEAVSRYRNGEDWWDVPYDEAKAEQEERRQADVWEPIVEKYLTHIPAHHEDGSCTWEQRSRPLDFVQTHRVLMEAINKPLAHCSRADQMRVAGILSVLGYRRAYATVDGSRQRVYCPTVSRPIVPPVVADPKVAIPDFDDVPY